MPSRTDLAGRAAELDASRAPFVWATVVRAERPTSAKPGDTALVLADGTIEGFVGGACAETTVRQQALDVLFQGETRLLRILPPPTPALTAATEGEDDDRPAAIGTDDRPGEVTVLNPCLSGGTLEIFLEPAVPRPLLLVLGKAPIARALIATNGMLGLEVGELGTTADGAVHIPWGASAVVVAPHGQLEPETINAALSRGVPYVGLVASRRRGEAVLDALSLEPALRALVHVPAGLDIGARTPGEVALSILAEIVSLRPRPGDPSGTPGQDAESPAGGAAPRMAVDPVCGMTVAAVESSLWADVGGDRVFFCGPGCRDAYIDDPGRYAK